MIDASSLRRFFAAVVVLVLIAILSGSSAQQPAETNRAPGNSVGGAPVPDKPQELNLSGQRARVVPLVGLNRPWALAFLPNGDMLITERPGTLRLIHGGVLDPEPIAGIPPVANFVFMGLMDLALSPRFAENRLIYFTYSKPTPGSPKTGTATLARARFDGGHRLMDVRDLFVSDIATIGNASRITFGPDGKLYMVIGIPIATPAASQVPGVPVRTPMDAQDPSNVGGKILRLNEDGTVPSDNPFVGRSGYRPEIYALGVRNALALVFHPQTGELWETENGPQGGDEINVIKAGRNYGWPIVSYGRAYSGELAGGPTGPVQAEPCAPGMEQPFLFWTPAIALSGMTFYTGDQFPTFKGNIFVGALKGQQLVRVVLNTQGLPIRRESLLTELKQRIREVRQGPDGLLYLLTDDSAGALLRIEPLPSAR
jgi:glucose/arabinose dehydrogenase